MSAILRKCFASKVALVCLVVFVFVQCSSALPTAFRNRLFDLETSADTANPEFARPDEADLQRNSARLHRTLFLLDTSDLLKNARLFGDKAKSGKESTRAKRQTGMVIRVRKPTLTFHEDQASPSLMDTIEELRKSLPI